MGISFGTRSIAKLFTVLLFVCLSSNLQAQSDNHASAMESLSKVENDSIDAFLMTKVSRSNIYIDEAIVLSCQLYTRVPLLAVKDIHYPNLAGFEVGSKPFYDHQGIPVFRKEKFNEVLYYVTDLRKIMIYPTKIGQLTIPEINAVFSFNDIYLDNHLKSNSSDRGVIKSVDKSLKSLPIFVKVAELPKKQPVDFSGAIGSFKIKSDINSSQAKLGELFALRVIVEGSGDLNISTAPILDLPEAIEVYDMKSEDTLIFSDLKLQSYRTFIYLLVASQAGSFKITGARFVYLDINSNTYKELRSSDHTILVKESKMKGSVTASM